ncbi:putative conserved secreted protein [Synechococcus sp. A18-25c]|uniref:hypothetical protein n=1 Tax=unclassified Synechococcus TaxID=2626047 RepID=UPI00164757B2|nr:MULTISPECIES: hypothetical protein [unclassified Synechococcus]QNI48893.1 putative conserved secreted protein [Synechococcus sp. A15-60]QNJ20500.1 putative conserved secreted protein [Synechococcus sp. A18-25c]
MVGRLASISVALGLLITPSFPARATEGENAITRLCLAGFNAAMAQAGKTPPDGMGDFTCDCFLTQVNEGRSIQTAQETCKQKAAQQFKI